MKSEAVTAVIQEYSLLKVINALEKHTAFIFKVKEWDEQTKRKQPSASFLLFACLGHFLTLKMEAVPQKYLYALAVYIVSNSRTQHSSLMVCTAPFIIL
jgi:hypothetical protein